MLKFQPPEISAVQIVSVGDPISRKNSTSASPWIEFQGKPNIGYHVAITNESEMGILIVGLNSNSEV